MRAIKSVNSDFIVAIEETLQQECESIDERTALHLGSMRQFLKVIVKGTGTARFGRIIRLGGLNVRCAVGIVPQ
jgi:hypothetical protein